MLFTQSRALHGRLRAFFQDELALRDGRNNVPLVDETRVALMFTADQFHAQVFDAMQANPLSALLSLAWTISSTSFSISPKMTDREYLAVWSPFFCAVNALCFLENKLVNRAAPLSTEPFDVEDLRTMDRQFVDNVRATLRLNPEERRALTKQRLSSELMEQLLANTPFGTYQIIDAPTTVRQSDHKVDLESDEWLYGTKRYKYVRSAVNVADRERYIALYARHEVTNRLRIQTEDRLRERFTDYHRMYGLNVNTWMIATHEKNEDGSRALIWQINKSALVWILYHSLGALVTLVDDPRLTADYIATVLSIDKFIECGMCLNHWRELYQPMWKLISQEHDELVRQGVFNDPSRRRRPDIDLKLLETHNDVQTTVDPRLRLTTAAVHALREDYLNLARSFVFAVTVRAPPDASSTNGQPLRPDSFSCPVYSRERERLDVCRESAELFAVALRDTVLYSCDPRREHVKQALLRLQWDSFNCQ